MVCPYLEGMADLNSTNIDENAEDPKRATVDGNTVEQFGIAEQIDAALFKASKEATASTKRGFAIQKFKAGGAQ